MKLLFIIPYAPNPIRVRSFQFIRSLAARGHEISLVTLYTGEKEMQDAEHMRRFCRQVYAFSLPRWQSLWNCLLALPSGDPLQSAYCWQPEAAKQCRELAEMRDAILRYDVIHMEHLRGVRYALALLRSSDGSLPPVVWDSVDSISYLFEQAMAQSKRVTSKLITRFELGRTRRYETRLLGRFEHILVTSQADRNAYLSLPQLEKPAEIHVVPNGVDLAYFKPNPALQREPWTLVVSGKMSYHANVTMVLYLAREIMPLVWEQKPQVKLWIVGKDPVREVLELTQDRRITVTGTVDDIRPYLQQASLAIAPLPYGAGIQNKVLEAMACGTPVVASSQAASALQAVEGKDIWVAGETAAFAEQVLRLLDDEKKRVDLGFAGRRYVEMFHDWDAIAAQLEAIYLQARV